MIERKLTEGEGEKKLITKKKEKKAERPEHDLHESVTVL